MEIKNAIVVYKYKSKNIRIKPSNFNYKTIFLDSFDFLKIGSKLVLIWLEVYFVSKAADLRSLQVD